MIDEYWDVQWTDGLWYSLHGYSHHVESIYGARTNVPSLRGSNVAIYGMPGQLHQPKMADQRTITLRGWVSNMSPSDEPYPYDDDCRKGLNTNWRMLRRLLWRENGAQFPLRRRWYDDDGVLVSAVAMVEYEGGLDLSEHVMEAGAWTCDLTLADPYFYETPQTVSLAIGVPQVLTVRGDIPTSRISMIVNGQIANVLVTNSTPNPDVWMQLGSAVAEADKIFIDADKFTAVRQSDGGNLVGAVTRSGTRKWMALLPGENQILMTASSGVGTVDLTWSAAYL